MFYLKICVLIKKKKEYFLISFKIMFISKLVFDSKNDLWNILELRNFP